MGRYTRRYDFDWVVSGIRYSGNQFAEAAGCPVPSLLPRGRGRLHSSLTRRDALGHQNKFRRSGAMRSLHAGALPGYAVAGF